MHTYPFNVFISYKINGRDDAIDNITRELSKNHKDKLHIFASTSMKAGSPWREEIHNELSKADLLILLYLDNSEQYDWCFYETGFLCGVASGTRDRKIITVTSENLNIPNPVEGWNGVKLNKIGVNKLLDAIYNDKDKPVFEHISDGKDFESRKKELDALNDYILTQLSPIIRKPITSRLWITINKSQFKRMEHGEIPKDIKINGESAAFRALGLNADKEISFEEFSNHAEYKRPMEYYLPHLFHSLLQIKNMCLDNLAIPPIRLLGKNAKTLVPTYMTTKFNHKSENQFKDEFEDKFEFVVYEPIANFDIEHTTDFSQLYNLFSISQHFKWRVIDKWINRFGNICSSQNISEKEKTSICAEFNRDYMLLQLESHNRYFQFPKQIEDLFDDIDDKRKIKELIGKNGQWYELDRKLQESVRTKDFDLIVELLNKMRPMNKEFIKMSLKRLMDLA